MHLCLLLKIHVGREKHDCCFNFLRPCGNKQGWKKKKMTLKYTKRTGAETQKELGLDAVTLHQGQKIIEEQLFVLHVSGNQCGI